MKPNFFFLGLISVFVIVEILFLQPSSVELTETETQSMFGSIETMVHAQKQQDQVGYSMEGFHYTAVQGEEKNWEIDAKEAVLYEKTRLVQAHAAKIKMFDSMGKITYIEGDEAYYRMGSKDIDLSGRVKVIFPDGFWVKTSKAHYSSFRNLIYTDTDFYGETSSEQNKKTGEMMQVEGTGFSASKAGPDIDISKNAHILLRRKEDEAVTEVFSDLAKINRIEKRSNFSMTASNRRVKSMQGSLNVESRVQEATYDSRTNAVQYLTATGDVIIRETDQERSKEGLKYATCQKADFLTKEDKILLTGFPSAYQGTDILTGETIIVHRSKNLVEVTQANAFHPANTGKK